MLDLVRDFNFQKEFVEISINESAKIILPVYISEYWTAKQRSGHSLHEVPYRACFKSQLPKFFIEKLTTEGQVVYDPFMGRGTTLIESALLNRQPIGCDVNPVCLSLARGRLNPPSLKEVEERLTNIKLGQIPIVSDDPLLTFYHPDTLVDLHSLREYLKNKRDNIDHWIEMVALTRLSGHSSSDKPDSGYFSVYTLPPNQAASVKSQQKINAKRNQKPVRKDIKKIILKKTKSLLRNFKEAPNFPKENKLLLSDCRFTPEIEDESVDLIVTSPPFLDIVDYQQDNWLRLWFLGIDPADIKVSIMKTLDSWNQFIVDSLKEFKRILKPSGNIAFEVGEAKGINLDEEVVKCAVVSGLKPVSILINEQNFTKTSNIWGVDNNKKGTNTNRIVLLKKEKNESLRSS